MARIILGFLIAAYAIACMLGMVVESCRRRGSPFSRAFRTVTVPIVVLAAAVSLCGMCADELMDWLCDVECRLDKCASPPAQQEHT